MRGMILSVVALTFLAQSSPAAAAPTFAFKDGDRIAFIGGTFVEREATFGYLETLLYTRNPDKNLTLRNLGWSGDNVWGESRAAFGKVADGYNLLIKQVNEVKPTVIFVCYGANESFEGDAGLSKFIEQLNVLLSDLAKTGARIVLFSPIPQEKLGPPYPDPAAHNKDLKLYADAIEKVAASRGDTFVDLFTPLATAFNATRSETPAPLTNNGVHLNHEGYRLAAEAIARGLGLGAASEATGGGPLSERAESMRQLIIQKNHLYFYRYRPQNETYIYGFRKHEQGQNAVEIPKFDPLIEEQEKQIAELRSEKPQK